MNRPDELMVPAAGSTDQSNAGCGLIGWLFWSYAVAVNCWVFPVCTEALVGTIATDVRTWVT